MIGFLALTDTSVHDAARIIRGADYTVSMLYDDTKLEGIDVLFVPSVQVFLNRSAELCNWEGVVIVFDCPVRCDGLVGITMLDVKERTQSFRYVFERISPDVLVNAVTHAIKEDEEVLFHRRTSNMIPYLLSRTSSSQMDRLQTWKYSIKNTELREQAVNVMISWFFAAKPDLTALQNRLMKLLSLDKSRALDILFDGSKFPELKKAVLTIKALKESGKTYLVDKIAEKEGVSPFDIRYILNAKEKIDKGGEVDPPLPIHEIQLAARHKQPCPLKEMEDDKDA